MLFPPSLHVDLGTYRSESHLKCSEFTMSQSCPVQLQGTPSKPAHSREPHPHPPNWSKKGSQEASVHMTQEATSGAGTCGLRPARKPGPAGECLSLTKVLLPLSRQTVSSGVHGRQRSHGSWTEGASCLRDPRKTCEAFLGSLEELVRKTDVE